LEQTAIDHIVAPHGGGLVDLLVDETRAGEMKQLSRDWPSWDLNLRQLSDVELLLNGGYSPLTGYMNRADYDSVCRTLHAADGALWPMPLYLDVPREFAEKLSEGGHLALRDPEGTMLAAVKIETLWEPDLAADAALVFGTNNPDHAGVARFLKKTNPVFVGGPVEGVQLPSYFDFQSLRLSPAEVRREFARLGWRAVVGVQTDRLIHRADQGFLYRAALNAKANLFIHPVVDISRSHDRSYYSEIRCFSALMLYFPLQTARLSLSPLQRRFAGPRESLWHGLVNKNFGCSHFVVDPSHADPNTENHEPPYYREEDHASLWQEHADEAGVAPINFERLVYDADSDDYLTPSALDGSQRTLTLSEDELHERLELGKEIPTWFTFPEIARELARAHQPRHRQGFTLFFTGLSGAGKSTIAAVLRARLMQMGQRPVTLLDGDIVRKNLSSELGFSKEHRNINIRRIGFVASEITKNGGIAICAPIAPYEAVREEVRRMIQPLGGFVLVHVSTPLEVCEARDRKGLYQKARDGIIKEFTGISDPYEVPKKPDVTLDTSGLTPAESAWEVMVHLEREGYIAAPSEDQA